MIRIGWDGEYILCYDNGVEVQVDDDLPDGDVVEGGCAPHKSSSTGRVNTQKGSYYPSVYKMKWHRNES